jgi:glutamate--cysteine ligase
MCFHPITPVPSISPGVPGPRLVVEGRLLQQQAEIEAWFRHHWHETPAPFYASVDLRNAGFKLAPVDTNLFPAGFNNLSPYSLPLCVQAIQAAFEQVDPDACRVMLIPESHTRNIYYMENVGTIEDIIRKAGFEVRIGSLIEGLAAPLEVALPSGRSLMLEPIERTGDKVHIGDFTPCVVLLNNDLASGRPAILEGISQPIVPPPRLGWTTRLKSDHFALYKAVAEEFASLIDIDPWLINPLYLKCGEIDFMKREGEECLAANIASLLQSIQRKYDEYGIEQTPFVAVKADAGTYGMGVMMVRSPEEIRALSRKGRTSMAHTKGGLAVSKVIIQEGVYTFETAADGQSVSEPVVYMIDHCVVGGFYRVHTRRGPDENLNAPGMQFEPLAFAGPCTTPECRLSPDALPNRFYAYGVIARLALLAAAREAVAAEGAAAGA